MDRAIPDDRLARVAPGAGLTSQEVAARRARFGDNRILEAKRGRWSGLAADTAADPMVWFMVAAAALYAGLGQSGEALVLLLALLPLLGMDAFLHWRTQASTASLRDRLAVTAKVIREGTASETAASDLVPGDLVRVETGDWIPADGLIETADGLLVDESTLTGEAMPVLKRPLAALGAPKIGAGIEDCFWASAGTRVLTGAAQVRIAFTGADTIYGQIVRSVQAEHSERTPLQRAIGELVAVLIGVAAFACLALALVRYAQGHGLADALLSAATLAVAALPEEFPVVFTFFLGVGVFRLAQRKALVRRGVAVENIGRVTCICTDKTGTLTEGRLTLEHVIPAAGVSDGELLSTAALASRQESADPIDTAILMRVQRPQLEQLAVFPFTEDRRREAAVARDGGAILAACKGAPETILGMAALSAGERHEWLRKVEELAGSAHRVIACARRSSAAWDGNEPGDGFEFMGLLAFEDPLRREVGESVAAARAAGIRIVMVTGDYAATARAVALELGLADGAPVVIEGDELHRRLNSGVEGAERGFDVVARATPAQKFELVQNLRRAGEVVAVTGDGVNDAPALRLADIGIAMGGRGAQTAREAAAIVLLDDSFETIVHAIAEGRQLFRNLQMSFAYLLMIHAPLVVSAAAVPFAGEPLLFLPLHIVWLELIIHPTALLVFQDLPDGGRGLRPLHARRGFFGRRHWLIIALVGALTTVAVLTAYQRAFTDGLGPEYARSAAIMTLVLAAAAIAAALSRLRTRTAVNTSVLTAASGLAMIQIPVVSGIMHLAPLRLDDLFGTIVSAAAIGLSAALFGIKEPQAPGR